MDKRNKYSMSKLKKEIGQCELCGNRRNLEVHHKIPISMIPTSMDGDVEDNMIVVCNVCHAKLTPKNLLVKYGMAKAKEKNVKIFALRNFATIFYETLDEIADDRPTAVDVCDVFDKSIDKAVEEVNCG